MIIETVDDSGGDREVIEDEVDEGGIASDDSGKVFALLLLPQVQQFRESEVLISFRF